MSNKARPRCAPSPFAIERAPAALLATLVVGLCLAGCPADPCCASDADCAVPARCFEGLCAPRCGFDSQCASGQVCVGGACAAPLRGPSQCPFDDVGKRPPPLEVPGPVDGGQSGCDEAFEANDEPDVAAPLEPGLHRGAICPSGDSDWFAFAAEETSDLVLRLRFAHPQGDLDFELVGPVPSLERAAVSQGVGELEEMRGLIVAGDWLVHVYGFGGAQNAYELELRLDPRGERCEDDGRDNHTRETAATLMLGAPTEGAYCQGSPDWYRADVDTEVLVVAELVYEPGQQLSLELHRPGVGLIGRSASGGGVERLEHVSELAGPLGVVVGGSLAVPTARPYSLLVRTEGVGCGYDEHEPNNTPAEATIVHTSPEGAASRGGRTCAGDLDIFRLSWTPPAFLLGVSLSGGEAVVGTLLRADDLSVVAVIPAGESWFGLLQAKDLTSEELLFVATGEEGSSSYVASFTALLGD
jgi:hypothetical protein